MLKKILLLALVCIVGNGYAQQRIERVDYQESTARNLEPEHFMLLTPLIADLEVSSEKVTHTEKAAFAEFPVTTAMIREIPEFKKIALSRAARACNADVMVGTTIDVITNSQGLLEITITGYPAHYRRFRNATLEDIDLIKQTRRADKGEHEAVAERPKDRSKIEVLK